MDICFDTSALNALCDDPDSETLIAKIKTSHRVLLTSLSIVEVVATPDETRRHNLLRCMKSLSDGTLPPSMPNKLLRRAARAFAKGKMSLVGTVTQEEIPMWWFINDASLAGQEEQDEALRWMGALEDPFRETHRKGREEFQKLLAEKPEIRPSSPGKFIKVLGNPFIQ